MLCHNKKLINMPNVVFHAYNSSTVDAEAEGSKFKASLNYTARSCLKKINKHNYIYITKERKDSGARLPLEPWVRPFTYLVPQFAHL
jgi:hypothetical protein